MEKQHICLPNAVFEQELTDKELAAFAILTARAEPQENGDRVATLSYSELARETGQSFSTAIRSIRSLERRKWITHVRGSRALPNRYRLLPDATGGSTFPFPVSAIKTMRGMQLRIFAYLCSCTASGVGIPPESQIAAALHLHPQTVREHLKALR